MRRRSALLPAAAALAAPLMLAACGGGDDLPVKVTGKYGERPDVTFPKGAKPGKKLVTSTLVKGKGAEVRRGDLVVANYVGYRWNGDGGKLVATSFAAGQPGAFPSGKLIKGLDAALSGRRAGSRVVAVIPPQDGYGSRGDSRHQVGPDDSLVYVLDVLGSYSKTTGVQGHPQPLNDSKLPQVGAAQPGQEPPVSIPKAAPPGALQVRTLIQGAGPAVKSNQLVALNFTGVLWRGGKPFYSTWKEGRPAGEVLGVGQDIKAFDQGLVGQRVGSRMLLVVPPKWGYGSKGLKQYDIRGDDTLVYVVDILGAY